MTDSGHIEHLLDDYLDGGLAPPDEERVARHLASCGACRAARERHAALIADLSDLGAVSPPRDLWPGIAARLDAPQTAALPPNGQSPRFVPADRPARRPLRRLVAVAAVLALVVLAGAVAWVVLEASRPSWDVVAVDGRPQVADAGLMGEGRLREGEWLETDAASRARLGVGVIGNVDVAPDTRVQLQRADARDQRLVLERGEIEARIWAPPRLFYVETPSALAIDLGCAYTLSVDDTGASLLHVTSGHVELVKNGRTTVVPAGAMSLARPGHGPGTVFDHKATDAFRAALHRYDFEAGGDGALADVLSEARPTDALTLWQILTESEPATRARLYDHLLTLVPPPEGVTPDGVLTGDDAMWSAWSRYLGLDPGWWGG